MLIFKLNLNGKLRCGVETPAIDGGGGADGEVWAIFSGLGDLLGCSLTFDLCSFVSFLNPILEAVEPGNVGCV